MHSLKDCEMDPSAYSDGPISSMKEILAERRDEFVIFWAKGAWEGDSEIMVWQIAALLEKSGMPKAGEGLLALESAAARSLEHMIATEQKGDYPWGSLERAGIRGKERKRPRDPYRIRVEETDWAIGGEEALEWAQSEVASEIPEAKRFFEAAAKEGALSPKGLALWERSALSKGLGKEGLEVSGQSKAKRV